MRRKSSVTSFRLHDEMLNSLHEEASEQRISLNTLVGQILAQHSEWDRSARKYGFVNIPPDFYKGLLDASDEQLLLRSAVRAGKQFREYLLFRFKRASPETFLEYLRLAARYSGLGSIDFKAVGPKHHLVVHHTFGRKHSIYVKTMLETAISTIIHTEPRCEIADSLVSIEFEVPPTQEILAEPAV